MDACSEVGGRGLGRAKAKAKLDGTAKGITVKGLRRGNRKIPSYFFIHFAQYKKEDSWGRWEGRLEGLWISPADFMGSERRTASGSRGVRAGGHGSHQRPGFALRLLRRWLLRTVFLGLSGRLVIFNWLQW